ncbi:MAG: hypothetical protein EOO65_05395 [Methanosarcinales archaeon]|nr:MAG: hypothetical protein EOO65_05395 [Methanosarcinales archaeon]
MESTLPVVQYYAKQGKVMSINANQSVEAVTADVVRALAPLLKEEVVDANQRLLDAIHTGDWATYNSMSDADLTAIERTYCRHAHLSHQPTLCTCMHHFCVSMRLSVYVCACVSVCVCSREQGRDSARHGLPSQDV